MSKDFERVVLPHVGAAYNLARWLIGSPADAEDVMQEAFLRAQRHFESFRGRDGRAWLLKIVRNASYSWMRKNRPALLAEEFDEMLHSSENIIENGEVKFLANIESERLRESLETLPLALREVLVLREMEGLSYKAISEVRGVPVGTVMSSLSRARQKLRNALSIAAGKEA